MGMTVATTAFSIVDAELWKPLPFPEPDQLVDIYLRRPAPRRVERIAGADFLDWQAQSRAFTDLAAQDDTRRGVLRRDATESLLVMPVTANYFRSWAGRRLSDARSRPATSAASAPAC